jgi:hypothetical protein
MVQGQQHLAHHGRPIGAGGVQLSVKIVQPRLVARVRRRGQAH